MSICWWIALQKHHTTIFWNPLFKYTLVVGLKQKSSSTTVFHKTYPFFLTLHTETLLMHQLPVALGGKDVWVCKETTRTWFVFMWTGTRCTQLRGENFHRSQLFYQMLFFTANFYNYSSQASQTQIKAWTVTVTLERNEVYLKPCQPTLPSYCNSFSSQ